MRGIYKLLINLLVKKTIKKHVKNSLITPLSQFTKRNQSVKICNSLIRNNL